MASEQPLLRSRSAGGKPGRGSASLPTGRPPSTPGCYGWLWLMAPLMIFLYTGAAFELPSRSPSFKEAAQISTLHGALFAGVALVTMATAHMLSPRTAPFPFTPVLAALPIAVVVLANAIIVPVLGTESWLDDETSVLLVIQMLAVAESAAAAATLLILWWRHCRGDRRRMAREAATAAAASTQSGAFGVRRAAGVPGGLPGAALAADEAGGDEDGADALSVDQIPAYLLAADREETSALLGLLGVGGPAAAAATKGAGAGGPSFMSPRSVAAVPGASPRLGYYPSASAAAAADAVAQQLNFSMASASAAGGGGVNGSMMMMPSDGGAAGGTPDAGAGGAGEDGGIDSLPLTVPPGLVVQRLLYLQRREADLTARLDAVTRELVAAAAGTGQTELPSLLRATQEELRALQDAHRDLQTRHAELELRAHVLEGELGIAQTKMGAVKKELRKEQGNNRKLLQNIEALRVAGMRSEAAIDDLQQRLSAAAAAAAASAAAASASASASGGGGGVSVSSGNMRAALRGDGSAAGGAPAGAGSAGAAGSGGGAAGTSVSSSGMGIALGMGMGGGTGNAALNASSLTRPSFMMHAAAAGLDGGRAGSAGGSVGGHGGPRSYAPAGPAPVGSYNSGGGGGGPLSAGAGSAVGSYGSSMAGSLRSSSRLVSQHSVGTIPPGALSHAASTAPLPLLPPAAPAPSGRSASPAVAVPISEAQPHDRRGKGGRGSSADGAFPDDI